MENSPFRYLVEKMDGLSELRLCVALGENGRKWREHQNTLTNTSINNTPSLL